VADYKKDILSFQRYVWGRLPVRKYLCGHHRVFDIAAVVIQEWPCEAIDQSQSGDTGEVQALEETASSCKRHIALTYGYPEYDHWADTLKYLIWQTIWITLRWYRSDPKAAKSLKKWRNRWRHRKG